MADNYGTGVSYVDQVDGYAYDTVVFQKGKPPLDTEFNAIQQIQNLLNQRGRYNLPSGWLSYKPYYINPQLSNSFYTQDPFASVPEYALVNGEVLYITNTATTTNNTNLIELGPPPLNGNQVNGVYLEVWRALLSPTTSMNRPAPETIIDSLYDISVIDKNTAWAVGDNGLILATPDAGQTWSIQTINTKNALNGVFFVTSNIGWTVGANGCIARTTSGGQRWNVLTTGYNQNLNSVCAVSQLTAWAVGDNGLILSTSNAVTWIAQTSGIDNDLNSVYFSNFNTLVGWAVGDNGIILKTTNGGVTWNVVPSGVTVNLNSVYFYNLSEGFAVGDSGTILKSTDGGALWTPLISGVNVSLTDVAMTPSLDQEVVGEEVTSQFNGSNTNFVTLNAPITIGDGRGTITNTPGDVTVTVNGSPVNVDTLVGATGQITLALPPQAGATVKVSYYYRITNNIFRGNVYVTGDIGTILYSGDVGATWIPLISNTAYELFGVGFGDLYNGWLVGANSIIRHTTDSGGGVPGLDQLVTAEDESAQFVGSNNTINTFNVPITTGTGQGIISNNPSDVVVTVNGSQVTVASVIGITGQIVLTLPAPAGAVVRVTYYYRVSTNSVVVPTVNDWVVQSSNVPYRQIQRSYKEGNVLSAVLIPDDSIHPDVNIETTERVQLQYAIRVVGNVDPLNYPEAGLGSQVIISQGPNSPTSPGFAYQNMGSVTGDYGLWRAQCANTVDGYCYAIPMFFVNRRNSSDYVPASNSNGTTNFLTNAIRLDLLTATSVIDSDILDVRRQIQVPAVAELLDTSFEQLMDGRLKTRMVLDTAGGNKFGTEIFQLDLVGAGPAGTLLNASLTDAVEGNISSQAALTPVQYSINATPSVPAPQVFTDVSGIFHPNSLYQSAIYGPSSGSYTGQTIPGYFTGYGTNQLTFTFDSSAATSLLLVSTYLINATQINTSSATLSQIPSIPELVKNISGTGDPDFYYQGVFSDSTGTLIEQWPSDNAPGYNSYAIVYPGSDLATSRTETMASTVEVHYLVMADSTNISTISTMNDTLTIPSSVAPSDASSQYNIMSVSKINNVTAGFSYKVKNIIVNNSTLNIQTVPGFPFIQGSVFEVIGQALSSTLSANIRNGASVNFVPAEKKIGEFCYSEYITYRPLGTTPTPITVSLSTPTNDTIVGVSSTDSTGAVNGLLPFCWYGASGQFGDVYPINGVSGFDTSALTFFISGLSSISTPVTIQVLVKQGTFTYPTIGGANPDGLLIGYDYVPYQSVSELPSALSAQVALKPTIINVSNLGTGGSSFAREPYEQPLINIPVNNPLLLTDDSFYNIEPLRFANFSVDGGFAQLPAYVPGNMGGVFNLSSPVKDNLSRYFYSANSQEFNFRTEGLLTPVSRKVFAGILGRVLSASDNRLLRGEYVLMIVSQDAFLNMENSVGFNANSNSVIAIYRLPNRPMVRI
jgi:photosystem II stability/assembly factor-like uncharacterized protein